MAAILDLHHSKHERRDQERKAGDKQIRSLTNVTTVESRLLIPVRTRFHEGPADDFILSVASEGVNQSDQRSEKQKRSAVSGDQMVVRAGKSRFLLTAAESWLLVKCKGILLFLFFVAVNCGCLFKLI